MDIFSSYITGTKESLDLIISLFPTITTMMIALYMLNASGLIYKISDIIYPLFSLLKIPKEIIPLAILRPVSGSGGIILLTEILKKYGADSLIGVTASVISGSTETTFYTLSLYFGSVEIKDVRYALKCAVLCDIVSIISASLISRFMLLK